MIIRPVEDADWASFLPVFHGIVDDGESYAYPSGLADDEVRALWDEGAPSVCVVAVDPATGELLGSAKTGPNRPGRGRARRHRVVHGGAGRPGRGVGRALGEWVLAWAREQGYAAMQFNAVVETNTAAVALWQDLGFVVVGTVPEAFDSRRHGRVGLHVMHRPL